MTCKFMPQIHATHASKICYAYVCVFTLSRRLRFMRDFVIVDKIKRNMPWHLDFVPWERETIFLCQSMHFSARWNMDKICVQLCVCVCEVCVRVLTHLTNVLKTNSVSFTVDGKSLFKTRVFLMHISCSFRIVSVCFGGVGGKQIINIRGK